MIRATESPWKYIVMWLRLYFAIHYLKSGLNYAIFGFIPDFSKAGAVGPYLAEMTNIGFYPLVKYLEVVLGFLLLFNLFVPLALIVMAGIAFQIVYLNYFISPHPRQLFTGTQELLLCGGLLLAYGGYYTDFLRAKAKRLFLWEGFTSRVNRSNSEIEKPSYKEITTYKETNSRKKIAAKHFVLIAGIVTVWTAIVIAFSTTLGARPQRLYDWGPPVAAGLMAMIFMLMDKTRRRR